MPVTPADIETALKLLAATPRRLTSASQGLDNSRLNLNPDTDAWSANDILAHLRACADVWGKSILAMIAQDHPILRHVSPRTWIRKTNYREQDFHESLRAFTRQRRELLKTLKALKRVGWSRGATVTGTTRRREQTILSYAQRLAGHEAAHCEQLEVVLKSGES